MANFEEEIGGDIGNQFDAAQPEPPPRPETGNMRFGDDWTGVFIRGDSAFAYRLALVHVLAAFEANKDCLLPAFGANSRSVDISIFQNVYVRLKLKALLQLLTESDERLTPGRRPEAQQARLVVEHA